mgnify:CR=1 FL=1
MAKPMTRKESEARSLRVAKKLFMAFVFLSSMFLIVKQTPLFAMAWAYSDTLVIGVGVSILSVGLASVEFFADSGVIMTKRKKAMLLAQEQKATLLAKEQG